mmetsp:Transcript_38734/g.75746  ORF Transcript_38734/g.75746 Transcript_38734/m.75746 type:complete len:325 (+) Transcript_38734:1-975(+)
MGVRLGLLLLVGAAEAFLNGPVLQLRGSAHCAVASVSGRSSFVGAQPLLLSRAAAGRAVGGARVHGGARHVLRAQAEGAEMTPDELITKLLETPPYQMPNVVAANIKAVSQPSFFMSIADRADKASSDEDKEALSVMADNVVATLEAVLARTEEKMDDASELVQMLLASAAEENGEFDVPLKPERVAFMRNKVKEQREAIDEGILATIFAYMKKANEDKLDGLVVIMQKLLQLWAAEELVAAGPGNEVLERLLKVEESEWDGLLEAAVAAGETDQETMQAAVQSCVERVVLQQASGSYGQRVQAEFLRELLSRLKGKKKSEEEK